MTVLDTSALSAIMHHDPSALGRIRQVEPWSLVICSPVAAEIHYGLSNLAEGSKRRGLLNKEYQLIRGVTRWVDWDERAAREFGTLKAALRRKGTPIDDFDVAIASIALALGAKLATRNARHFERIDGLDVEDWLQPE